MYGHSTIARLVLLLLVAFFSSPLDATTADPLLKLAPLQNPCDAGWELRGTPLFDGGWIEEGKPGQGCLVVRQGWWQSPPLAVEPFHYYRLKFSSKTECHAFWAVAFLDEKGQELAADLYDGIDVTRDWQSATFCFRAHALAKRVRIRFQPNAKTLFVKDVFLERVNVADVAAWADGVAAANPLLRYEATANRCERLPKTMKTLQQGGKVRIVMLGDSICNDTSNSLYETLLMPHLSEGTHRGCHLGAGRHGLPVL